jgi:hypothetical protein
MGDSLKRAQTPANCAWSRVGFRLSGVAESAQPESIFVCVREPRARRSVELVDCANCPYWVKDKGPAKITTSYATPLWRFQCE